MSWPSRRAHICFGITEVIEEMVEESLPAIEFGSLTLDRAGIGQHPIGQGEFLEFQARLEKKFGIKFNPDEIPTDPALAGELTLDEIATKIINKRNAT
ncbi:MAG: hypothetical protein RJA61_32 [Candidatus Parcubacteria bacterium]|jgi:hypothetical protein